MNAAPGKAPKKEKVRKQTPEERAEALRYNHMMYGPTAGERRPVAKKVNYGAAYLQHPKFLELMTAFRKGTAFKFDVTDKARTYTIATSESQISFDGRILFYSRALNKYEENLLLDRSVVIQYQVVDALVHLVFAVLRHFPELDAPALSYLNQQFYCEGESLDAGIPTQGPNLLLGPYRHSKAQDKARA